MLYTSTRGFNEQISSCMAVLRGIAPDNGLYMPAAFPGKQDMEALMSLSFKGMAAKLFTMFLDDFPDMEGIVSRAYDGRFDTEEVTPLRKAGDTYYLELFHGPTYAFKDVALSALPQLLVSAKQALSEGKETVILTATSGDTGKAAMAGFRDVPGTRICVFYPEGGVSPIQQLQMTTQEGANVRACAVRGNFDDAQTAVKRVFDRIVKEGVPEGIPVTFSSANSINIGRLVPQITYYVKAYADLLASGAVRYGDPVDYTVPTGNFGDILAGYFAKMLGLPVGRLVCASNDNRVLTAFFETGVYDRNRPFYRTISPSMDILVSSNLERMLYLASGGDTGFTASCMRRLFGEGVYTVPAGIREKLAETFSAGYADEAEVRATIGRVFREDGYLVDPHTAVAAAVSGRFRRREGGKEVPNVVLSTASPFKFPQAVLEALGESVPETEFQMMGKLSGLSGLPVPENLAALPFKEVRFGDCVGKDGLYDYVMEKVCR